MNKGAFYVLLSGIVWGALSIFWKQLSTFDAMYILCSRIFWSTVFSGIVLFSRKRIKETLDVLHDQKTRRRLIAAGAVIACNWCLYIYAVSLGRIMQASLAYYISPLLSIILAALVFREKLSALQWLAAGIAAVGVLVSVLGYGEVPLLALGLAATFAVYGMIKKSVVQVEGEASVFLEMLFLAPVALAGLIVLETLGKGALSQPFNWRMLLLPLTGAATGVPLMLSH